MTNVLYRNRGDGTFEDVTVEAGAGRRDHGQPRAGMGIAVGDPDGDGRPDILVTNFAGEPKTLYRNVEGALFDDATEASGVERPSLPYVLWGTDIVDLDDDGRPDLVIVSGHLIPKMIMTMARLFGNSKSLGPTARRPQLQAAARSVPQRGRRPDGGRDAVLGRLRRPAPLGARPRGGRRRRRRARGPRDRVDHRGRARPAERDGGAGNALEILPVAGADRRTVLGTKIVVTAGGVRQVQEFILRPSYASGAWLPLHFGLGAAKTATVEVIPPGATEPAAKFENVAASRLYVLKDGALTERRAFRR